MDQSFLRFLVLYVCLLCGAAFQIMAQERSPSPVAKDQQSAGLYAPYAFLIGEWDVKAENDDKLVAVQKVRWGPNKSYMWYSVVLMSDGHEEPHLEGMLMWNGVHKNLDMLFAIDLNSGRIQEQGTISVAPDGGLVREITAIYSEGLPKSGGQTVGPEGATGHFRQTYKQIGPDKIQTSVMRQTKTGWVASFPGSDHLVMTRRSG